MPFLVIQQVSQYEPPSIYGLDTIHELEAYLSKNKKYIEDMDVYEFVQKDFDLEGMVMRYEDTLEKRRQAALAKLTDEDKVLLGITRV